MTRLFALLFLVTSTGLLACFAPPQQIGNPTPINKTMFKLSEWREAPLLGPSQKQHNGQILAMTEISKTGELEPSLVTVGADGAILLWNIRSGDAVKAKQLPDQPAVAALGERKALVAWSSPHRISIGCISGCSKEWRLTSLKVMPTNLAFQGNDDALLIAGADGRVYRWMFMREELASSVQEKEKSLERYVGHQTIVSAVANHPYQRAFFSTDWDGALYGWLPYSADDHQGVYDRNLFSGRSYTDATSFVRALRAGDRGISAIALSGDGNKIALGTDEGHVEIWEVRGLTLAAKKQLHTGRVLSVALDMTGERVVSSGRDSAVIVSALQRDPDFGIKPNSYPNLLNQLSSQKLEYADRVLFLSNSHIIVSTKQGVLAELSGSMTPRVDPGPIIPPTSSPEERDSDY